MHPRKIDKLGRIGYSRSVHPFTTFTEYEGAVVGFDTEYTTGKHVLISYQLYGNGKGKLWRVKPGKLLRPSTLLSSACELLGYSPKRLLFVTYFSLAELQFLPVSSEGISIREYAGGSLDVDFACTHKTNGYGCIITIFDLWRWFNFQSLKKAAKSSGLKKKEWNTKKVTRSMLSNKRFREYAIHDAYLCYEIFNRLRATFKTLAKVDIVRARTPANASQQVFRRLFVKEIIHNDNNRSRLMAMRGAWGGRAEVFKRGRLAGTYTEYDFTGAYPASCIKIRDFPIQNSWRKFRRWSDLRKARGGFFKVRFAFPLGYAYPNLPVHTRDCLLFPSQGESNATLYEIQEAREMGCTVKVIEGWYYNKGSRCLSDYMEMVIEERKKVTGATAEMFKLLGNSLTGKFAQAVNKVSINERIALAERLGTTLDDVFDLNTEELIALQCRDTISVGSVFMPEWYGLITGYTRAALAKMIRGSGAVYCHTDSVWCKHKPSCDGMLDFEKKGSGRVVIVRTRFARIGNFHTAHHSIWNRDAAANMLKRFSGSTFVHKYKVEKALKLKEACKSGRKVGEWVTLDRKGRTFWCGKRRLLKDGNTLPWRDKDEYLEYKNST